MAALAMFPASLPPKTGHSGKGMFKNLTLRRSTKSVSSLLTFSKGGPIGMSLSEKMPLTSVARMPYTQIIATSASMATVKKKGKKSQF